MIDSIDRKWNGLPDFPKSWYRFSTQRELSRGPLSRMVAGQKLVAFRTRAMPTTNSGARASDVAILAARCCHMGTDLGNGAVVEGALECPFHNWRFDATGTCVHIPCTDAIPGFARQAAYPVAALRDQLFCFNSPSPNFPLPFFDSIQPQALINSSSFSFEVDCPWYMISANACDWQHFRTGHDRQLLADPIVTQPNPFAYRTLYQLEIVGNSWSDRLTRALAGRRVELEITVWGGTIVLVKSTLERAQSFGMVSIIPGAEKKSVAHVVVWAHRSKVPAIGWLVDRLSIELRRILIHRFLATDAPRLAGTDICPLTLIDADQGLSNYFEWLQALPQ